MKASVITPVWNRADLTFNFLNQNLHYFGDNPEIEFIIIDNGSTDGTQGVIRLQSEKPNVTIIKNETNLGFSKANNQGAEIAKGDVLIFINNDVLISGDYITPICGILEGHPRALAGAELLDCDTGWNRFGNTIVEYIHGWLVAMRKETFIELGQFDERYTPGDYEDIDLSYTATLSGRELIPLKLPVKHLSGQTGKLLPDRQAMTIRHRAKFASKWRLPNVEIKTKELK